MKPDPTKKIRALASKKSRQEKDTYVYIHQFGKVYKMGGSKRPETILCYKNGNEIAL